MGNSINPHIEHAQKTGACNLSNQKFTEFPGPVLGLAKTLRTLDLSSNRLPSIPPAIGSFQVLKSLNLSDNRLGHLPDDVGKLKKLETLTLDNNRLTSLPASLSQLRALRVITLSNNVLKSFPTQLCGLKQLDSIDLSRNKMSGVPDGLEGLECIELNLNQNQISRLNDCLADCPRLKVLRVEENCLDIEALTPRIMRDSQISTFAVEGNLFEMKKFHHLEGYDQFMERYTAAKKKIR